MMLFRFLYRLSSLLVLCSFSLPLWAQESLQSPLQLSGRVVDAKGKPVVAATVVVATDSMGVKNMRYAITKADGSFRITRIIAASSSYWVNARSVGFKDYKRRFTAIPPQLQIVLEEQLTEMERVVVVGKAPDVYEKGDTLVYNPKNYTLGNERNIGQVIKRMPGLSVNASGKVSYQGKEVDKVLINGKDVLGTSSEGMAINNLPPDFAHSIELLKDYRDSSDIAQDFHEDKMIALNLKSDRKMTLNGSIEGGGGLIDKFNGRLSLISILPKVTLSAIITGNNTGRALFSIQDYTGNVLDAESLGSNINLTLSQEESELFTPPLNEYERTGGLANLNLTVTPHQKYRLQASTIYHQGDARGAKSSNLFYYRPEDNFESYTEHSTHKKNLNLWQFFYQRWRVTQRFTIKANTSLNYRTSRATELFEDSYLTQHLAAENDRKGQYLSLKQDVELQGRVGKGVAYLGARLQLDDGELQQQLYSTEGLLPLQNERAAGRYHWHYQKRTRKENYSLFGGMIYPVLSALFLKAEASYGQEREHLLLRKMTWKDDADEFLNHNAPRLYTGVFRNVGDLYFSVGSYFSWYSTPVFLSASKEVKGRVYVEPLASLVFRINKYQDVNLSLTERVEPMSVDELSREALPKDYNILQQPSAVNSPYTRSLQGMGRWFYYNLFDRLIMLALVNYTNMRDLGLYTASSQGLLSTYYYQMHGKNESLVPSFYLSKGIPRVPIDVQCQLIATLRQSNQVSEGEEDRLQYRSLRGRLGVVTRWRNSLVNGELNAHYERGRSLFSESKITTHSESIQGDATLYFRLGYFTASLKGKLSRLRLATTSQDFADVDATLSYKINALTISVSGEDLFHLRESEWRNDVLTTHFRGFYRYRRMPGYALLSLRWEF